MQRHLTRFVDRLEGVLTTSSGYKARCPCPDHGGEGKGDGDPSLSVNLGDDDRILCHCFGGCPLDAVLEAMGLAHTDLWPGPGDDEDGDEIAPHNEFAKAKGRAAASNGSFIDAHLTGLVYETLLSRLTLTESHRQQLRGRGLNDEQINHGGYRSLKFFDFRQHAVASLRDEFGEDLLKVPGFIRKAGRITAVAVPNGLIVPVRDAAGLVIALKVRRDEVDQGGKYLWFSGGDGPSCGSPVHVPQGVTPAQLMRVTEGPLKADIVAALSGLPTIAVAGVTNWGPAVPWLKQRGVKVARLAFDSDAAVNGNIANQLLAFADALAEEGIAVELERWPAAVAKGIDDLLAMGGIPDVLGVDVAMQAIQDLAAGAQPDDQEDAVDAIVASGLTAEASSHGQGGTPIVAPAGSSKLAAFPLDVFPISVARFAAAMADSIGCPIDFVAHAQVTVAAAGIGDSRTLYLGGNWFESGRIFACIIGPPGTAKSPALNAVVQPVYRLQRAHDLRYVKRERDYEVKLAEYHQKTKESKAAAKPKKGGNSDAPAVDAPVVVLLPEKPERPRPVRVITSDATVEALAPILRQNPRGLIMHRDELSSWVRTMNMYRGGLGGDRQFYLSAWSGQDVVVDRKGEGPRSLYVAHPFVCVLGSIQPDMLTELADAKGRQDGFLDRILFCFPDTSVGQPWPDSKVTTAIVGSWSEVLRRLYRLKMVEREDGTTRPKVVRMTPEATAILKSWWSKHREEMNNKAFDRELLGGAFAKYRAHVARLALILHLLRVTCHETTSPRVDAESARRATRLADYYKSHAIKVYGRLRVAVEDKRAEAVIAWVREQGGKCTARDLCRNEVAGIKKASDAKSMLKDLDDRGLGRCEGKFQGKKESVTFTAGPVVG